MRTRCEAQVTTKGLSMGQIHQCRNTAKVERCGISFCKVHDPIVLDQRRESQNGVIAARNRDRRRAIQDQQIGSAVRKLFKPGADTKTIMAWVDDEHVTYAELPDADRRWPFPIRKRGF